MKKARTPLMRLLLETFSRSVTMHEFDASRRRFIQQSVLGAGALVAGSTLLESFAPRPAAVAILGAGIAGLHCGYLLKKAGIPFTIYEASKRAGGRMYSAKNITGEGIVTELGAEFIDSIHFDILNLATEFNLSLVDMEEDRDVEKYLFFFGNRKFTCKDVSEAFAPFAQSIMHDIDLMPDMLRYDNFGDCKKWDDMSIVQYLTSKGMDGWLLQLFETAFTTEYGLDAGEQSAINLLFLFSADMPNCSLFGVSDERYKIKGGNQRITDELAARVGEIQFEHAVSKIADAPGRQYEVSFGNQKKIIADHIICTIPFSILRNIDLNLDKMTPVKQKSIQELGYGRNAKIFAGFGKHPWREMKHSGEVFTDESFQLGWEHSQLQGTAESGYTFFTGGTQTDKMKGVTLEKKVETYMAQLGKIYPGVEKEYNKKAGEFYWPDHPHAKASYACYRTGQWTTIAGAEQESIGNILFAGEHCSYNFQGFMNGGAETGRVAAEKLIAVLKN